MVRYQEKGCTFIVWIEIFGRLMQGFRQKDTFFA